MALESLRALYLEQLQDLYSAENQILKALPKIIKATSHSELKNGFQLHEQQTREHVRRLEQIFDNLDEDPEGEKCVGMEGLLKEGEKTLREKADSDVLDAALIAAAQRVEHYEMAGYGCARTYARMLGEQEDAALLQKTLDEEGETDKKLTMLAERCVNLDAADAPRTGVRSASEREVRSTATRERTATPSGKKTTQRGRTTGSEKTR